MTTKFILALLQLPKIGPKTAFKILNIATNEIKSTDDFFHLIQDSRKNNGRIPDFEKLDIVNALKKAEIILNSAQALEIQVVSLHDTNYPNRFKSLTPPPLILYVKGNSLALNDLNTVAVIGTRNPTEFGIQEGYKLTKHFVENNFTIVSGLALGCDTVGHSCCLEHKGRTIAVLPNGVDKIYPKQNIKLATEIIKNGGALISEYPPGTAPKRNYFVERDRLQSGLSNGICIIETETKGGTMHTYKFAKEQNKQVGLVYHPEKFRSSKSEGNLSIINDKTGFKLETKREINEFIALILDSKLSII